MLRDHITDLLPPGNSRPLYVRWTEGGRTTAWVRAGDLRRAAASLVMVPRWDGEAFSLLWEAAATDHPGDRDDPFVAFAVPDDHRLSCVATARVGPTLQRRVRDAVRRSQIKPAGLRRRVSRRASRRARCVRQQDGRVG